MKKVKRTAVRAAIALMCAAAGYGAGRYAERKQEPQETQQEPQAGLYFDTHDGRGSVGLLWGYESNI